MCLLCFGKTFESISQVTHDRIQRLHIARRICQGYAQLIHCALYFIRWFRQTAKHLSQRSTCLTCFDSGICHQTDCNGTILYGIPQRPGYRRNVLERFSHHCHVCIGIRGSFRQNIRKMGGIKSFQSKSCQSIRYNITGCCQIFSRCSGKVHDPFQTIYHVLRLPACHSHVFHSLRAFCG